MHAYELSPYPASRSTFHKDIKSLKAATRLIPHTTRVDARIKLVDVSLAKVDVVAVLNGQDPKAVVLRHWRLSNRGRLIEIATNSED